MILDLLLNSYLIIYLSKYYPCAIHLHLEVALLYINQTSNLSVVTVVVGNVAAQSSKEVHRVIALAAVQVIVIHSFCHSVGIQLRLVVNDVISSACAVIIYIS
jgi:hypothetical protein